MHSVIVEARPVSVETVALVAYLFARGRVLTVDEVAALMDDTPAAAAALLKRLARVLPLEASPETCGRWCATIEEEA